MKRDLVIFMHRHCMVSAAANRRAGVMDKAANMLICARDYRTSLRRDADLPAGVLAIFLREEKTSESECSEIHSDEPISWDEFAGNHR